MLALDNSRELFASRLKVLNLSKNSLNFKNLAGIIGNSKTI
jgi:hypothetical protein